MTQLTSRSATLLALAILGIGGLLCQQGLTVDHKTTNKKLAGANATAELNLDTDVEALFKRLEKLPASERRRELTTQHANQSLRTRARQKIAYALARILERTGTAPDLEKACNLYKEASEFDALWERSLLHTSDCANALGNEQLVRSTTETLAAKSTIPKLRAQALYGLAQSYLRTNEPDKAEAEFNRVLKIAPESQFGIGSKYYLGQAQFQRKNDEEGLTLWRQYLAKSPDGRFARDILKILTAGNVVAPLNSAPQLTAADHLLFADVYYANGECAKAIQEWGKAASKPWYKYASALLRAGRKPEAESAFMEGITGHPKEAAVVEAAKTMARIGTKQEAIAVWKTVLENCPDFGDAALFNLATRAPDDQTAQEYYERLLKDFPDSDWGPETAWWLSWNKIKQGQTSAELIEQLANFGVKYEKARAGPRFLYWIGKLEEKQNHKEAAIEAYKHTIAKFAHNYYGYRAQERINALTGKSDRGWATALDKHLAEYPLLASKGGWSWPTPPQLVSYQRIAQEGTATVAYLAEIQQWDECLDLFPKGRLPQFTAICLAKLNRPMEAINTVGRELQGRASKTDPRWRIAYPLLHADTISAEAQAKKVDPFLAQALIREESRYNVMAVSSSNALGLMQLLPGTAMGVAKRLGVKLNGNKDIHKPEYNIKFGIDYIAYTMSRHDGSALFAVASYNGGPNAVASWRKKISTADLDYFVENIPFLETRDYVKKVFGSYWNYEAIYDSSRS